MDTSELYSELTGSDIYKQHDRAFRGVSAYVIARDGKQVAKIALQFARSGLRTTAWVHVLGLRMVKGNASGGGYDKASAAVHAALRKISTKATDHADNDRAFKMRNAVKDAGQHWDDDLRSAGFDVWQAV